jgi:hypothetical protein
MWWVVSVTPKGINQKVFIMEKVIQKEKRRKIVLSTLNKNMIITRKKKRIKMGLDSGQAICIHYDVPSRV